jgi:curved DNA-binding protein CbpA
MNPHSSLDYYEDLQVNQNADFEMIERAFRLLAKRYHPDNRQTGSVEKFQIIHTAYQILHDPKKRAAYDAKYNEEITSRWKIFDEDLNSDEFDTDLKIRQGVLSLLYVKRRKDVTNPGMGIVEIEKLLGCTQNQIEFHIWYLKEKGWISRDDNGAFVITANGVDKVTENNQPLKVDRLIPEKNPGS